MTSDTCVLSAKQDGGSGDDRDFLLFWASINGMVPTIQSGSRCPCEKGVYVFCCGLETRSPVLLSSRCLGDDRECACGPENSTSNQ